MTISSSSNKAGPYTSTGTGPFPFAFKVFSSSDLEVVKTSAAGVESTLALSTHYTASLNADQNNDPGGSITLLTAQVAGEKLTLIRTIDAVQETDIQNAGGFFPEVIENALDRITMLTQQILERLGRSIRGAVSDSAEMADLPAAAARVGLYLTFDSNGDPTVSAGTGADAGLRQDLASSAAGRGGSLVATISSRSGAVATDIKTRLSEIPSVFDYMTTSEKLACVIGAATVDVTHAFLSAIASGEIHAVPPGNYLLTQPLTIDAGGFAGADNSISGSQRSILTFSGLTDTSIGAINTRRATWKGGFIKLDRLYIKAASWHAVTGALGYGIDLECPVLAEDVTVFGFKKSGWWFHRANNGDGPYGSLLVNCRAYTNGQHGMLIGNLGNTLTFVHPICFWNGAPSYGVAPSVAGSYDGFRVARTQDGGTYGPDIPPEAVTVIGGDCSYNSGYGWNFLNMESSVMQPGYAELNLHGGGYEAHVGTIYGSTVNFGKLLNGPVALHYEQTYGPYNTTNNIVAVGRHYGGGTDAGFTTVYDYKNSTEVGQALYKKRWNYLGYAANGVDLTIVESDTDGDANYISAGAATHKFISGLEVGNQNIADANRLDWYKEGFFVPVISGTTAAGAGTYTVQTGHYTRIGNRVFFSLALTWTAHTGTGNMQIDGLPFAAAAILVQPVSAYWDSLTFTGVVPNAAIPSGQTFVRLYNAPATTAGVSLLALDTAATICINGSYEV